MRGRRPVRRHFGRVAQTAHGRTTDGRWRLASRVLFARPPATVRGAGEGAHAHHTRRSTCFTAKKATPSLSLLRVRCDVVSTEISRRYCGRRVITVSVYYRTREQQAEPLSTSRAARTLCVFSVSPSVARRRGLSIADARNTTTTRPWTRRTRVTGTDGDEACSRNRTGKKSDADDFELIRGGITTAMTVRYLYVSEKRKTIARREGKKNSTHKRTRTHNLNTVVHDARARAGRYATELHTHE